MRVADAVVRTLIDGGVDHVFGIPGIHTLSLYDALADEPRIRHVGTRSEAAAATAADGFARVAGRPAAVSTTTGIAAFGTIGALSEADLDGSPVLLLAGQIPSDLVGVGRGVLHETDDQAAAFAPVCGLIERPRTPTEVVEAVARAIASLRASHPRPAYVELPMDLLDADVEAVARVDGRDGDGEDRAGLLADRSAAILAAASRPVIIAGGAIRTEAAIAALGALATDLAAPVLHSVPGRGTIAPGHPLDAGPLVPGRGDGSRLLEEADAILVAGDRLDEVTTAAWTLRYGGPLIQLHPRVDWHGRGADVEVAIGGPVSASLGAIREALGDRGSGSDDDAAASERAQAARDALRESVHPRSRPWLAAFEDLRRGLPPETIIVGDAAAIDSWPAFFWPAPAPETFLFPWGSAALGFGLPAAIGASLAAPGSPVLAVCGDGGFAYVAMELGSVVQHGASVVTIVAADGGYGSIAAYQEGRFGRSFATELGSPDLGALVRSFGLPVRLVDAPDDLAGAVAGLTAGEGRGVVVIEGPVPAPW